MLDSRARCIEINNDGGICRTFMAQTRNISRSGMCLLTPGMVHLGRWVVAFVALRGNGEKALVGLVCQTRYEPSIGFLAGMEFKEPCFPGAYRTIRALTGQSPG